MTGGELVKTQRTHSHILMTGGGGGPNESLGLKLWPKVIFFLVYERRGEFLGHEKNRGIFWVTKKGLMDFYGCAKKK